MTLFRQRQHSGFGRGRARGRAAADLLFLAWDAADDEARRSFLSTLFARVCTPPPLSGKAARESANLPLSGEAIDRFISQHIKPSRGDRIQSSKLHEAFEKWCLAQGEASWSMRRFSLALKTRGYLKIASSQMWWRDIALVGIDTSATRRERSSR